MKKLTFLKSEKLALLTDNFLGSDNVMDVTYLSDARMYRVTSLGKKLTSVCSLEGDIPNSEDDIPNSEDDIPNSEDDIPNSEDGVHSSEDKTLCSVYDFCISEGAVCNSGDEVPSSQGDI